jgi:hypothetical protein
MLPPLYSARYALGVQKNERVEGVTRETNAMVQIEGKRLMIERASGICHITLCGKTWQHREFRTPVP